MKFKRLVNINDKQQTIYKVRTCLIYLFYFGILMVLFCNKEGFHVDEWYSYGGANTPDCINYLFEMINSGNVYRPASSFFVSFLNGGAPFDFSSAWNNQIADVHPPFYYIILHLACMFTMNKFSFWSGAFVNIIFAMVSLFVFRRCINMFGFDDKIVDILSIGFILHAGILSCISFYRMYAMAMMWVLVFFYVVVHSIYEDVKLCKYGIVIMITTLLGTLTHYYVLLYIGIFSVLFFVIKLWQKRFLEAGVFAASVLAGSICACLSFPQMINHVFGSYRGKQSIENLSNINDYEQRFELIISGALNRNFFANQGGIVLIVLLVCILTIIVKIIPVKRSQAILSGYGKLEKDKKQNVRMIYTLVLLIAPLLFFMQFVYKSVPYFTDRYFFPVFIILYLAIFTIFAGATEILLPKKMINSVLLVIVLLFSTMTLYKNDWEYLYLGQEEQILKVKEYSNNDVVVIYDPSIEWELMSDFQFFMDFDSIRFVKYEDVADTVFDDNSKDELVISLWGGDETSDYMDVLLNETEYDSWELICNTQYGTNYILHK